MTPLGLAAGDRPDERGGRPSEPECRRLGPGQPALRHHGGRDLAGARDADSRSTPHGAGLGTTRSTSRKAQEGAAFPRRSPCRRTNRRSERSAAAGDPLRQCGGDCSEVPDVSADADPSSGYVIYDSVNGLNWNTLGGTGAAAPLWAAVVAVVASANGNTVGYGALNPALYLLAQSVHWRVPQRRDHGEQRLQRHRRRSNPGHAPVTTWQPAWARRWRQPWPLASLSSTAAGRRVGHPDVRGVAEFRAVPKFFRTGTMPSGVTLNTGGLSCTTVGTSTTISPTLTPGAILSWRHRAVG